jgi:hypothetical protein
MIHSVRHKPDHRRPDRADRRGAPEAGVIVRLTAKSTRTVSRLSRSAESGRMLIPPLDSYE